MSEDRTQAAGFLPSLAVVIPTARGGEDLERCLTSLAAEAYPALDVVVIDNGADLQTITGTRVLRNEVNVGFVRAVNQGLDVVDADLVLLLNDDTVVQPGALRALVASLVERPAWGAAQAKLLRQDDPTRLDTAGSFLTATGFLVHRGSGEPEQRYGTSDEIFAAKGAALLLRGAALAQVGALDDDYFAYLEETDLCWRLWLAGWRVGFAADARIEHKLGATAGQLPTQFVQFHSFKNRISMLTKNLGPARLLWMLPYHVALCLGLAVLYGLRGRPRLGLAILRAIWWNVVHLPRTLRKRRRVQRLRCRSDSDLTAAIMRPTPLRTLARYARVTAGSEPGVS
jgi:GT2 family glycosyltransferase